MSKITITPINKLGEDQRGATYDFKLRDVSDFIFIYRKQGSLSGNTYHEGKNRGTNPKTFVLLQGTIELSYREIGTEQVEQIVIEQPSIIEVQPMVTHAVKALSDYYILENNSIADIQQDRFRENVVLAEDS